MHQLASYCVTFSMCGITVQAVTTDAEAEVLAALARIIDPDFGEDIVACGFVKDLEADSDTGRAAFRLLLTTPACPVKEEFERLVLIPSRPSSPCFFDTDLAQQITPNPAEDQSLVCGASAQAALFLSLVQFVSDHSRIHM